MFRRDPEKYIKMTGADTVITDESHRGKNEGVGVTEALKNTRGLYKNYIGMTGSIISNKISDVHPLIDVATGGQHGLGDSKDDFEKKWLVRSKDKMYRHLHEKRIPITGFKKRNTLKAELLKYIDYADYEDIKDIAKMPEKDLHVVKVPISAEQAKLYKKMVNNDPAVRKMIFRKRLETLKDDEAAKAFSSLMEERKLMNNAGAIVPGTSLKDGLSKSPKTQKLLEDLDKHLQMTPDGQAILFSHLINGGVDVMEEGLKQRGIPYGKFIGKGNPGITEQTRQTDVNDFNKRKKRVMLISSAGGEGVSLNDTTWEGVLDPHYNPEKMKQMEARGIRSHGLSHRPPAQRKVEVNRYIATMPKTLGIIKSRYRTPDEFIYDIAQNKERQNKLMYDLLKEDRKKNKRG
jgi:SNF2 family DNA or RNA helicase